MTPNVMKRPEMQKTQYPKNDPPKFLGKALYYGKTQVGLK